MQLMSTVVPDGVHSISSQSLTARISSSPRPRTEGQVLLAARFQVGAQVGGVVRMEVGTHYGLPR
jgi:hypothetical protein